MTKKRPHQPKGKKKSKKRVAKSSALPIDLLKQVPPDSITLGDFFPDVYFDKVAVNTTSEAISEVSKEEKMNKWRKS